MLCTLHPLDLSPQHQQMFLNAGDAAQPDVNITNSTWVRRFNFQPDGAPVPDFYRVDTGAQYGLRSNGMTYGWNIDNRDGRDRNVLADQRYDTLHHLQKNNQNLFWELAVANGTYTVRVVVGDPSFNDSVYRVNVEGQLTVNATPTSSNRFFEGTRTVNVTDGRLTIASASGAVNNKIAFVEICRGDAPLPVVNLAATSPNASESGANGVFTFTRTGSTAASLTVSYAVGGTATMGSDYQNLSGTVTFAAGASTATVVITPIDDPIAEPTETVIMSLRAAEAYSNGFNSTATVNIADNDTGGGGGGGTTTPLGNLSWSTKANSPLGRSEAFGAAVGGKFYVFGGYIDSTYKPTKQAHVYNPANNTWTRLKDIPVATSHVANANDDRYIYTVGGYPAGPTGAQTFATNAAWRYDTTTDTWASLPNLPQARGSMATALVGRTLYAFGGSDASRIDRNDHWALNLDNTAAGWVTKKPMPAGRNHFAAAAINGLIYSVGGQTKQDTQAVYHNDVFRYNPATDNWDSVAPTINQPRSHANNSTIAHNGRIIILGGVTNANTTTMANVEAYDPATNKWSVLTAIPFRAMAGVAGSFGDKIIFSTGFGGGQIRVATYLGTFS